MSEITPVPETPAFVSGVMNLRGKVIPVLDMRLRFGQQERPHDERTCIIVTQVDGISVGLIVDTVAEVLDIEADSIDPPPQIANSGSHQFIQGLGRVDNEVKILVNLKKVLNDEVTAAILDTETTD